MRFLGHPIHVMLVHFPVALWPAHCVLHFFAERLPAGASALAGFWLLAAGTSLGWLAAFFGATDLLEISREKNPRRFATAGIHALVNGTVLIGFTVVLALEYSHYPAIVHGSRFLAGEVALIGALFVGNYFGGAVIWGKSSSP